MLVAHGAWAAGRLAVWAEDTSGVPGSPTSGRHPFAASVSDLDAVLGVDASHAESAELRMLLPGSTRTPLPSPESGLDVSVRAPKIRAWRVPALLLDPGAAVRLLDRLDAGEQPTADGLEWGPGASLRYLALLARTASDLVRRGRVLPQLTFSGGLASACWRPVLIGADASLRRDLIAAMPPVCRAATVERPAAEVLSEALDALTDAAVRRAHRERLVMIGRPGVKKPLVDRWIMALTGEDATLPDARPAEVDELRGALDAWYAAAHDLDAPIRVCFRLTEPEPDSDTWLIQFALQSADDPSLFVPADLVWNGQQVPGLPSRADEILLAGLGRAVGLHPDLYPALEVARPTAMEVDTAWAFGFLRHAAPLLQAAGFGIQLPAWAGRKNLGLKLTTRSRSGPGAAARQGFGLDELVDFRFELAVSEHAVTEAELAELAELKVPLVRVRGHWVELDSGQLKAALTVLEQRRSGTMTLDEALREVVRGGDPDLPLVEVDADGALADLLDTADQRLAPVPTPVGFHGILRPYQERGLSWLSFLSGLGLGGILADDMGLGKTAQTLSLLLAERCGGHPRPTLLICPMSLLRNWQKEAERFAPSLRVYLHHGGTRKREQELADAIGSADLVLTTYGTALRDLSVLSGFTWERVVCDEAQAIKNSSARQAQAVRSLPARTRLALTGTPVENHLAELWSIMEFVNPGLLGSARRFRERFQVPIETRADEQASTLLRRATGPFILRRLKTDKTIISDLPDKLEMKTWCSLTAEQASLYQAVLTDMMDKIESTEGIERRGNVLATMTRLKQVCNHPAHLLKDGSKLEGRSGKLARLEELAEEIIAEGDKALIFTQYAEFGALLQPYLSARLDRPVLWLHGGLPKRRRDELVERFGEEEEPMLFLLSLKAAGTGLNLTAANHVIHVDRWWNPAVENQATDRAFRIGQTKNVQVRKFICTGTLEERIDEMIERKRALAETVVGTGEDWLAELSTERLRELFRLDPSAVS